MNSSDNYQLFIKDFLYFCDMRKLIFSLLVSVAAYAAAETPDIPAASPDSTAATAPEPVLPGLPAAIIYGTEYVPSCLLSDDEVARRFAFDAPSYSPLITSWRSGAVWAEGGSASLPGMAGVESGTINATQRIGNIYVSAYAGATKYGYFRGLSTQWQFGGTLHWQFAPRLGITLFGSYSTSAWQPGMSPGIAEMISRPEFGGYLSWDITERFGVAAVYPHDIPALPSAIIPFADIFSSSCHKILLTTLMTLNSSFVYRFVLFLGGSKKPPALNLSKMIDKSRWRIYNIYYFCNTTYSVSYFDLYIPS